MLVECRHPESNESIQRGHTRPRNQKRKRSEVKRYEGLFIVETAGKEEGLKDTIDKISAEITSAGGKVETVQKMDKRNFARVADKKHNAGQYVNVIFESNPSTLTNLRHRFAMSEDDFRLLVTEAAAPKAAAAANAK